MRTPILYNDTFTIGNNIFLNAAVGNNGVQDHVTYGIGYDIATKLLIRESKKGAIPIDAVIHPLVFCARHRIELCLKNQLITMPLMRANSSLSEELLMGTHDLGRLWELFKKNARITDRRFLPFIDEAEDIMADFAEIDPTGETFRYPYDKYKTQHLQNTPIINVEEFEKQYLKIAGLMEDLEYLADYLVDEYSKKTFTKNLSREDLYEISKALPARADWITEALTTAKKAIKAKFKIGSREFSEALNVIQAHREFCANIGMEIPIAGLEPAIFKRFLEMHREIHRKRDGEDAVVEPHKNRIRELQSAIPKEPASCLYALKELGKLAYFEEDFDRLYDESLKDSDDEYHYDRMCNEIINGRRAIEFITKGLMKTGQTTLLALCQDDQGQPRGRSLISK